MLLRTRRAFRRHLSAAVVPLLLLSCREQPTPLIGAALGATLNEAVSLALEDATPPGSPPIADTLFLSEQSSVAASAIELASTLLAKPNLVAVVGHTNSSASLAAAQLYNDAKVVELAPTSTAQLYSEAGPYSFRMVPPDHRQGRVLAQAVAAERPNDARVALLYVNDDYGRSLRTVVSAGLDSLKLAVVADLPHLDSPGRARTVLADIESVIRANPNVIVWLGRPASLHAVLPAIRASLGELPVFASDATTAWSLGGNLDGVLTGVRYVDFVDLDATTEGRRFRERYRARFGRAPGGGEALAYDAMRVLVEAIRSGARSGEDVRRFLDQLGRERPAIQGVTGLISFSVDGDVRRDPILLRIPAPDSIANTSP
jgi:branched-chain amino acid transport system substrate-binding protein